MTSQPRFFKIACLLSLLIAPFAGAEEIGQIKLVRGEVTLDRAGTVSTPTAGDALERADILRTGGDGVVGLTFTDNSRVSLGPDSEFSVEVYAFEGEGGADNKFDSRLTQGSLTAASGLIAKTPDAMRVLMPTTVLGVRGTEFAVRVGQ